MRYDLALGACCNIYMHMALVAFPKVVSFMGVSCFHSFLYRYMDTGPHFLSLKDMWLKVKTPGIA